MTKIKVETVVWDRQSKIYKTYQGPKYPTKAYGKIPAFNSYEEEANFWDTHDFIDLMPLESCQPKEEALVLRVNKSMKKKLEEVAKKKKVSVSTLSRVWLSERLQSFT